jgi:hypothetical protein
LGVALEFYIHTNHHGVVVVQNNLLNLDGLNAGTLMAVDIHSGEVLKTLDMKATYGLMPESIEAAFGHGHDLHH